ncbi:family 2 glycosyl transferase [Campylobacter sputorum subsp. bubulus]|uniref:Family 2 glycosyl transferase n=1 Tax=Campylobacter sputorum subsp. sputorum TaxID=32024 RepID=A0A381DIL0_9BACT|nr:glycosyltransferase family 2 protein [Campylobacter sputorum]ASM35567.1 glycosyltransferase, family 2 [Campylobacter sputorum aubsp. sputorum RM3237]QEL05758.1 glycosyltransferase, family 2 [Campylobacter sputorum subsp. sputorum]SUX08144.1 family 2 glycosyl transferase [Campylobacter sputorum subsp. bubulus]SUX10533.1 family 2 glycosyl transferase [Campylobacter sputorum subsp. sputorum]
MNDLVSVIMPSYGSEKFIEEAIKSVLFQTYDNYELIIIDDCSPDNSNKIIEEYIKKYNKIKFIKLEKNSGSAIARNKGIKAAKGRYIAFLDADDLWLSNKLEAQVKFMQDNNLVFTYSSYNLIDEKGEYLGKFTIKPKISYNSILKTCDIGCSTAIYDTKKLSKIYMPLDAHKREDYATWLKILKLVNNTNGLLDITASYRLYNKSLSSNKFHMAICQWKIYRKFEKLNLLTSTYYFLNYALNGFLKYKKTNK